QGPQEGRSKAQGRQLHRRPGVPTRLPRKAVFPRCPTATGPARPRSSRPYRSRPPGSKVVALGREGEGAPRVTIRGLAMPDGSYRAVLRPLLFRFPPETARDLSLGTIGALGRSGIGSAVIDFLGHMRADPRLETSLLGRVFPTAVGLGAGLDPDAVATPGLARFGLGFIELGPVTLEPITAPGTTTRDLELET